jgi:phosphoglycolate phosphatase-like HAD superfamily hydrolase
MKRILVLFDIDGTILLTAGAGRRAILRALREEIAAGPEAEQVRFDGKTDPQIVRELLAASGHPSPGEPALVARLCERYVAFLADELTAGRGRTTLLPGVERLLARLAAEEEVLVGLLTGNVAPGAALKLRSGGIDPATFPLGAYGSDSHHRPDLPAIAAERARPWFGGAPHGHAVVIIGDTPADVTCGRGISARAIGVATGSYAPGDLEAAGAFATFPDLSDTDQVLEAILCPATNSN